ncbi:MULTISPECIES: siderophore-interacting protein [Pseudomonas]|uniref:siderophore-interacting protein n=1 Tax=Pseudomonas TaxID=286 RepID=UPI0015B730B4|nr:MULTISPECIES: siderophore-interacting protein [Pseudomonas]WHL27107.1 siderophore-interacting protein [Pseudomonas juntendi]
MNPASERAWLLLAGDEAALPGIAAILETLPEDLVTHVFIEIPNADEQQPLTVSENTYVRWISRQGESGQPEETLAEVLRYSPLPTRSGDAWLAGEASIIRLLRTRLLRERSFELGRVHAAGYWKQGEQDHGDLAAG